MVKILSLSAVNVSKGGEGRKQGRNRFSGSVNLFRGLPLVRFTFARIWMFSSSKKVICSAFIRRHNTCSAFWTSDVRQTEI